jgi:hypothetical protein
MKLMPAVFAAVALTAVAGAAQADVGPDEVIRLYKSQALGDFEQFNKQAVGQGPHRPPDLSDRTERRQGCGVELRR